MPEVAARDEEVTPAGCRHRFAARLSGRACEGSEDRELRRRGVPPRATAAGAEKRWSARFGRAESDRLTRHAPSAGGRPTLQQIPSRRESLWRRWRSGLATLSSVGRGAGGLSPKGGCPGASPLTCGARSVAGPRCRSARPHAAPENPIQNPYFVRRCGPFPGIIRPSRAKDGASAERPLRDASTDHEST